jgi:tetratricopeptide (TPR) repeat protein
VTQQHSDKPASQSPPGALIADQELAKVLEKLPPGKASVTVSGDVVDSIIVTGDENNVVGTLIVGSDAGVQELELRLAPAPGSGYIVRASIGDERRPVTSSFRSPFSELELHGARMALRRGELTEDGRAYGDRLFQALFTPPILELYRMCLERPNPVRIRLELSDQVMQELPWELLWDSEEAQWLVQRGMVTRAGQGQARRRSGPIATLSPFRVLILDLQRSGSETAPGTISAAALERSVSDMERDKRLNVMRAAAETMEHVEAAVARAAGPERWLDVVHVLGLEADDERCSPALLGSLMERFEVQVAALSTAQSSSGSTSQTTIQAGPILMEQGVSAVLGVPLRGAEEVDAHVFRGLCTAFWEGDPVDLALARAIQRRSRGEDVPEALTGAPICYLAPGEAVRFDVQTPPPIRLTWRTWRPWLHERVSATKAAAATVALATGLAVAIPSGWTMLFPAALPAMIGSTNIAVAEFGQIDARGAVRPWDKGAELASRFAADLNDRRGPLDEAVEAATGGALDMRGPELTGRIAGQTAEDRERTAERLAKDIHADLIVSGNVSADGRRFVPEIFVSGRRGLNTVDAGFYAFGEIGLRPDANLFASMNDQQELQQRLVQSTRSLVAFVLGVNAYATHDYDQATSHFQDAVAAAAVNLDPASPPTRTTEGLEMLHLLMGDVAGKRAAAAVAQPTADRRSLFDQARAHYERSLALDPEFARAYIGLAEVTYLQAQGSCPRSSPSIDVNGLKSSIGLYERALSATHQTAIANIGPKAHFGIGRASYCLSRAGASGFSSQDARAELKQVVDAYSSKLNPRMKDWAIEAQALMGGIALLDADYSGAATAFTAAIDLSSLQSEDEMGGEAERRYLFCRNLGRVHAHLGVVSASGAGVVQVTREPMCQEQFREGFGLGKRGQ